MTENHSSNKPSLGIGMIVIAWLLILAAAALWYQEWADKKRIPNQTIASNISINKTSIKLTANKQHQYLAHGQIGNVKGVFIVDTGATEVVVPQTLARKAGLSAGAATKAMTANGIITVYQTTIPVLNIGALVIRNVSASINPAMHGTDILLGMSALKDMEIRQSNGVLTIIQNH